MYMQVPTKNGLLLLKAELLLSTNFIWSIATPARVKPYYYINMALIIIYNIKYIYVTEQISSYCIYIAKHLMHCMGLDYQFVLIRESPLIIF